MHTVRIVAVTGADGFIGKNLCLRLSELERYTVAPVVRASGTEDWRAALDGADAVVHLAGVNRPQSEADFMGNLQSVEALIAAIGSGDNFLPIILSSSIKAAEDSAYGASKRAAEDALLAYSQREGVPTAIYRLPNVFGKWCKPNYNSAVATFCYNIAHGQEIKIDDPTTPLSLVYIDDVLASFIDQLDRRFTTGFYEVKPIYHYTVGEIAGLVSKFGNDRASNLIENVGVGFVRALHATFLSYLPLDSFAYPIERHSDRRGAFSEMLKTREAGQFSYFTAFPGMTRGGHYHHTKTEKFLVVHGEALFRFRHMLTGETHEVRTSGEEPCVVETIPGWTHDVTNVGDTIMISMLWANEVFDREKPDTIIAPL